MHRFVWDLRLPPPPVLEHEYPISAISGDTPQEPLGPFVLPGTYTVKLTADGNVLTRPLTVKMDPRVAMSPADLAAQLALARRITAALEKLDAVRVKTNAAAPRNRGSLEARLLKLYEIVESADDAPTLQAVAAVDELEKRVEAFLAPAKAAGKR
jgi:hypothetical protein